MKKRIAGLLLLALATGLLGGCEYRGSIGGSVTDPTGTAQVTGSPAPRVGEDSRMGPDTPGAPL